MYQAIRLTLCIVQPASLLPDIVAVFTVTAAGRLDMCAHKTLMQRREKNRIRGIEIQVRMGRPLFAHLIAHTPVLNTGEAGQSGLDDRMCKSVLSRIVKGQLILSCLVSYATLPFQNYTKHGVAKG